MARSSNRFFDCFRTETVESSDDVSGPSPLGAEKQHKIGSDGKRIEDQRTRRSLRRLAKQLISHAASVTKNRRKKSKNKLNNSYSSTYNEMLTKDKDPQSANDSRANDLKTKSRSTFSINSSSLNSLSSTSSTPLCSSSGSSVISTTSIRRDEYLDYKPSKQPWYRNFLNGKNRDLYFGLCMFLICLLILTCWGKAFAIFYTSALFVLIPGRGKKVNLVGHGQLCSRQIDWKEHKKAVIMEGLLSRNRNHLYS